MTSSTLPLVPLTPPSADDPRLSGFASEVYTAEEEAVLSRFFTNTRLPVFGLRDLPQVVAGALFARYSRTHKPLRRLFLDEFMGMGAGGSGPSPEAMAEVTRALVGEGNVDPSRARLHAEKLYERVFLGFGDDSVAQLGGAHVAVEQVSNLMSKLIEWGRLASYLEQSTRYIRYDDRLLLANGSSRFRFHIPDEVSAAGLTDEFTSGMDRLFSTYAEVVSALEAHFAAQPRPEGLGDVQWRGLVRSQACDAARGLLPAATRSNLGVFASGQAYEQLLLRLQASPLSEAHLFGGMLLGELRQLIGSFLSRVDRPDRGVAWSEYLASTRADTAAVASNLAARLLPADVGAASADLVDEVSGDSVRLVSWDADAEIRITRALLFESGLSQVQAERLATRLSSDEVSRLWAAAVGERQNRRHRPSRAFEEATYRFEVVSDYGAFRDLQRHRMMSMFWHPLSTADGFAVPDVVADLGLGERYSEAMSAAAGLASSLAVDVSPAAASYAVPFGYRLRYSLTFNVRQAFHMLELRTQSNGHPSYRRVAALMFQAIRDVAGHQRIAAAMSHVNEEMLTSGRLDEVRRAS